MRTIYKFALDVGLNKVPVTKGAIPLTVGIDPRSGLPSVWTELNTNSEPMDGEMFLVGTGQDLDKKLPEYDKTSDEEMWRYVGSVIGHLGVYVWHVYARADEGPWELGL